MKYMLPFLLVGCSGPIDDSGLPRHEVDETIVFNLWVDETCPEPTYYIRRNVRAEVDLYVGHEVRWSGQPNFVEPIRLDSDCAIGYVEHPVEAGSWFDLMYFPERD